MQGYQKIQEIRREIEDCRDSRIWDDMVRAVSLVSDLVFARSSHFIMEFIQNAEDAGRGLDSKGKMEIRISKNRIIISHNARVFNDLDVDAICGIRSTKKPELGSIGYMGIGFKSVYKVTTAPHIYSGDFHFKFDISGWEDPSIVPWQTIPLIAETEIENINEDITYFYIPFRNELAYLDTKEELENLGVHLYLFLNWLKKIEIIYEEEQISMVIENHGKIDDIVCITKRIIEMDTENITTEEKHRFLIFRKKLAVPENIKNDIITKGAKRDKVINREVVIAYTLDDRDNLTPFDIAKAYGGVYSFLPLSEEKSGAKFLMEADFIVVPGRESINYEALWNTWLLDGIAELVIKSIDIFKDNEKWKHQYLDVIYFNYFSGPSYENFFNPYLHSKVEGYLNEIECIPTIDGDFTSVSNIVQLDYSQLELINEENLNYFFPEMEDPKIISPNTKTGRFSPETISNLSIMKNIDFLEAKSREPTAIDWFLKAYRLIEEWARSYKSGAGYLWRESLLPIPILTENLEIKDYTEVKFRNIPEEVIILAENYPEIEQILQSLSFIHPILEEEMKTFFRDYLRLRNLNYLNICRDLFVPKIIVSESQPSRTELIAYTKLIQKSGLHMYGQEIWVLTTDNNIRASSEVFFSGQYLPEQNWEINRKYLSDREFLSSDYLESDDQGIEEWKSFFSTAKVKEKGENEAVDEFGVNLMLEQIQEQVFQDQLQINYVGYNDVQDRRDRGYDFLILSSNREDVYMEVKSRTSAYEIELTRQETEVADREKKNYLMVIINGIPENPEIFCIWDPVNHGKKDKVTLKKETWERFRINI